MHRFAFPLRVTRAISRRENKRGIYIIGSHRQPRARNFIDDSYIIIDTNVKQYSRVNR